MTTTRHHLDYYQTSEKLTEIFLETVDIRGSCLEPCAGDGAIARLLPNCYTNDIDAERETDYNIDASDNVSWSLLGEWEWIVTNPPFSQATDILQNAWEHSRIGMAFLLRLSYLEPCKDRRNFLRKTSDNLRYLIPVNPRPKFRSDKKGGDNVTVAWFIWKKNFSWREKGIESPFLFITDWRKKE
jgi:hypothetical protein